MNDKYGYKIPDKANIIGVRTGKNPNPDQDKILETANIVIDKVMEVFPSEQPQAVNVLATALEYYFIREMQNQIEKHERGGTPMYQTICASIMHAQKIMEGMSQALSIQMEDIFDYLKDKPKLGTDEMNLIKEEIFKHGVYRGK